MNSLRFLSLLLFVLIASSLGCKPTGSTRLCEDFRSYETLQVVRAELARKGLGTEWKESLQGTEPGDRRPAYKIVYLSGPARLSNVDGHLRFMFYNDRLMEMQFSTNRGNEYAAELRRENMAVPQNPTEEMATDRRTRFRFDSGPNGSTVFTWYDSKLEEEWKRWVAANS